MNFCPGQHDPSVGRYKDGRCKACQAESAKRYSQRNLQESREQQHSEYIPEVAMLRRRLGVSREELAWEARLGTDVEYLAKLENAEVAAPLQVRLDILHALAYFRDQRDRESEREEEEYRRRVMCGIG